jgi:hypothetical protein
MEPMSRGRRSWRRWPSCPTSSVPFWSCSSRDLQFAGWSGGEIAGALGKSPAAIRMARHRAVERLKKLLNPEQKARGGI